MPEIRNGVEIDFEKVKKIARRIIFVEKEYSRTNEKSAKTIEKIMEIIEEELDAF